MIAPCSAGRSHSAALPARTSRSAVRVRNVDQQRFRGQAMLLLDLSGSIHLHIARDADQVHCEDYQPRALLVLDRQGLGEQVLRHALRRFLARGVAGHPHRAFGGDFHPGGARLPRRLVARRTGPYPAGHQPGRQNCMKKCQTLHDSTFLFLGQRICRPGAPAAVELPVFGAFFTACGRKTRIRRRTSRVPPQSASAGPHGHKRACVAIYPETFAPQRF